MKEQIETLIQTWEKGLAELNEKEKWAIGKQLATLNRNFSLAGLTLALCIRDVKKIIKQA